MRWDDRLLDDMRRGAHRRRRHLLNAAIWCALAATTLALFAGWGLVLPLIGGVTLLVCWMVR